MTGPEHYREAGSRPDAAARAPDKGRARDFLEYPAVWVPVLAFTAYMLIAAVVVLAARP